MSWTTYTVYNFADDLHWPELGILLESIDSWNCKEGFISWKHVWGSLNGNNSLKEDLTLWWNMLLTVRNIPLERSNISFYRVKYKIRGSCHYLVTTYFFWIENIPQDINCDTRDVLVQYIDSVIKTDIPDESDVELCQLVKRLPTHSHSKYFQKKNTTFIRSF